MRRLILSGKVTLSCESGAQFTPRGHHMQGLLSVLGCSPSGSAAREELIRLLWDAEPDDDEARLRLRQLFYRLKVQVDRAIQASSTIFGSDKSAIWLNPQSVQSDISLIRKLLEDETEAACEHALHLWNGPVLDPETCVTERLAQWIEHHNRDVRTQLKTAGKILLNRYLSEGLVHAAVRIAVRLAGLDLADTALQRSAIHTCITCGNPETGLHLFLTHRDYLYAKTSDTVAPDLAALVAPLMSGAVTAVMPIPDTAKRPPDTLAPVRGLEIVCTLHIQIALPETSIQTVEQMERTLHAERLVQLITTSVLALDGFIASSLTTQAKAYFRGPVGTETTALRAAYAATRIMREAGNLPSSGSFALKMLITTYKYTDGDEEPETTYETPTTWENEAEAGQILLCPATRKLVRGIFDCGSDIADTETAYTVLGRRFPTPRHFGIRLNKGLSPLIGRDAELAYLHEKWRAVCSGDQQLGLICGPLGAGKSRLTFEFERHVADTNGTILHLDCNYIHRNTAYYPIRVFLFDLIGTDLGVSELQNRARAVQFFTNRNLRPDDFGEVWDLLLKPDTASLPPVSRASVYGIRFLNQLSRLFLQLLGEEPALIVLEDAEWIDASTQQFFETLASLQSGQGRLTLCTVGQIESTPALVRRSNFSLSVGALSPLQCAELLDRLDPDIILAPQDRANIIRASDNLPMHIEELVKAQLDPDPEETLATSLPDVIARRIGDLIEVSDPLRSPHHCGAIVGAEFSSPLIALACELDHLTVARHLDDLVTRNILRVEHRGDRKTYRFSYPSIRQYFCRQVDAPTEQKICHALATAAETLGVAAGVCTITLARLWQRSGDSVRAARTFLEAARAANLQSQYEEASGLLTEALDGLTHREEAAHTLELEVRVELATTLTRSRGIASEAARAAWADAYAQSLLCDDARLRFRIQWGQWSVAAGSLNLNHAHALSTRLLHDATRLKDPGYALEAHHCAWTTAHLSGHLERAEYHVKRGLDAGFRVDFDLSEAYGGHDPRVCACVVGSLVSQLRGEQSLATSRRDQALRLAGQLGHQGSMAHALLGVLNLAVLLDNPRDIQNHVREMGDFAQSERYFEFGLIANLFDAWATARLHPGPDTLQHMRDMASLRFQAQTMGLPFHMWLMAETELRIGDMERAEDLLAQALHCTTSTGELWWKPQILLTSAEISGTKDRKTLASEAATLARQQGASFLAERAQRALSASEA